MCIVIGCCPGCDVISLNYNFLSQPFFYITKNSGQKRKCLKNEKSFWHEIKNLSLFLKVVQLSEIVSDSKVGLKDQEIAWRSC